ncbi:hypothetical protein BGZ61DRAFT_436950 [Ilyonectria robusta]|uniref:uncharacterized protein n=1 Tax=Ilyonectria robusta TaxID=1079257 RepID=UPI001E8D25C6|nr:uncharacterized protein BGZ61DRAFT_436950 [Ilyonectria robusta]KAH8736747.1 hypothetical protein BGZ61DRAFT_436950 [Ilyonectria robusta]
MALPSSSFLPDSLLCCFFYPMGSCAISPYRQFELPCPAGCSVVQRHAMPTTPRFPLPLPLSTCTTYSFPLNTFLPLPLPSTSLPLNTLTYPFTTIALCTGNRPQPRGPGPSTGP